MSNNGKDIDEEIKKISRKTNLGIEKSERSFENQLKKLDKEIDKTIKSQIKAFDDNKNLTSKHLSNDYYSSSIERYKEKLKRI